MEPTNASQRDDWSAAWHFHCDVEGAAGEQWTIYYNSLVLKMDDVDDQYASYTWRQLRSSAAYPSTSSYWGTSSSTNSSLDGGYRYYRQESGHSPH